MKICSKALLVAAIVLIAVIPGVYGSEISVVGGASSNSIRNDATEYTIAANLKANNTPAWSNNEEDFSFATQGFIATDDPLIITAKWLYLRIHYPPPNDTSSYQQCHY